MTPNNDFAQDLTQDLTAEGIDVSRKPDHLVVYWGGYRAKIVPPTPGDDGILCWRVGDVALHWSANTDNIKSVIIAHTIKLHCGPASLQGLPTRALGLLRDFTQDGYEAQTRAALLEYIGERCKGAVADRMTSRDRAAVTLRIAEQDLKTAEGALAQAQCAEHNTLRAIEEAGL